jgi:hypothetical protein
MYVLAAVSQFYLSNICIELRRAAIAVVIHIVAAPNCPLPPTLDKLQIEFQSSSRGVESRNLKAQELSYPCVHAIPLEV